jgi:two-component system, chemotaxis family, chemotaxis protein CheY
MVNINMKILVVDDSATMRRIVTNVLSMLGFSNITLAIDGTEALQLLVSDDFDLIVSDWSMEPVSGMDLLKHVRKDGKLKNLPFIMLSGESDKKSIIATMKNGVSEYIVKPFSKETLRSKIQNIFGSL